MIYSGNFDQTIPFIPPAVYPHDLAFDNLLAACEKHANGQEEVAMLIVKEEIPISMPGLLILRFHKDAFTKMMEAFILLNPYYLILLPLT